MQEDSDQLPSQIIESVKNNPSEGSYLQTEGHFGSPGAQSLTYKQRLPPPAPHLTQGMLIFLAIPVYYPCIRNYAIDCSRSSSCYFNMSPIKYYIAGE